jgi:hypothetical protein
MKKRLHAYYGILILTIFSQCGINDLEERVDQLNKTTKSIEETLGHTGPMYINFSVVSGPNGSNTYTDTYHFNGNTTNALYYDPATTDSLYFVQIEKTAAIGGHEKVNISLYYNQYTKQFSDILLIIHLIDNKGRLINQELNQLNAQFTLTVKEWDMNTGLIDIATTSHFIYHQVENCSFRFLFRGNLKVFKRPINSSSRYE